MVGGCIPAKPRWSEMIVFWMFSSGRAPPYRRKLPAPMRGSFIGRQTAPGSSAPGRECWPEEVAMQTAELRRSRGGRR
mgnify:FL=1